MWLGIDLGTQSTKVVVQDAAGHVRGHARAGYAIDYPRPGWAEQPPSRWLEALGQAVPRALSAARIDGRQLQGLAVTGQLDGCVPMAAPGQAAGPALIWLDKRAVEAPSPVSAETLRAIAGQVFDASHMAAKIRWLVAHGTARRFHQPVGFIVEHLTGEAVIDPALASTTMLFDLAAGAWSRPLLEAFAIAPEWLPTVRPATAIAGGVRADIARAWGLPRDLPVAVGTGDDFATPLGAGVALGEGVCVVGTAEVVGARTRTPLRDDQGLVETHAYPAGGWFVENPGWMSGGALTWLAGLTSVSEAQLVDEAASIAVGADGVTFIPALSGAMAPRWNARARGCFLGLSPVHGRGHLARAVLEAMAFAERDVVDRLVALGVTPSRVWLLGGGNVSAWAQIRADVTGRPHARAARDDTAAVGAAMVAAVATGAVPSLDTFAPPPPLELMVPAPATAAAYADAHARYRTAFDALEPAMWQPTLSL